MLYTSLITYSSWTSKSLYFAHKKLMISKFLTAPMWEDHDSGLGLSSQARLDYFIEALAPSMVAHSCNPNPWKAKADN